jgi:hypothetical protein
MMGPSKKSLLRKAKKMTDWIVKKCVVCGLVDLGPLATWSVAMCGWVCSGCQGEHEFSSLDNEPTEPNEGPEAA